MTLAELRDLYADVDLIDCGNRVAIIQLRDSLTAVIAHLIDLEKERTCDPRSL